MKNSAITLTVLLLSLIFTTGCSNKAAKAEERRLQQIERNKTIARNREIVRQNQMAANKRNQALQRQRQEEARKQQQLALEQQQVNYDLMYERELRKFLRTKGFSDVGTLARGHMIGVKWGREIGYPANQPTQAQADKFIASLSPPDRDAVNKAGTREFSEAVLEFEDNLQTQLAQQQAQQRQQALRALGALSGGQIGGGAGKFSMNCGIAPIPQLGCSIGRCVNGRWEQVCN